VRCRHIAVSDTTQRASEKVPFRSKEANKKSERAENGPKAPRFRLGLLLNPPELNLRAFEGNAFREYFLEFFYFYIQSPPPSRPRVHDATRPLLVAWRCQNHFPFLSFHPVVDVKTHVARVVRIPRVSKSRAVVVQYFPKELLKIRMYPSGRLRYKMRRRRAVAADSATHSHPSPLPRLILRVPRPGRRRLPWRGGWVPPPPRSPPVFFFCSFRFVWCSSVTPTRLS
jgi:hypothetical protein